MFVNKLYSVDNYNEINVMPSPAVGNTLLNDGEHMPHTVHDC